VHRSTTPADQLDTAPFDVAAVDNADEFEMEVHDPVLNRRVHHRYRIATLPVNA